MILGVIADDFTGATDVASMLVQAGMRTLQVIGVPDQAPPGADAVVVADLRTLAEACASLPLITAGSGVALGLPAVYAARGLAQTA